jgi:uncharacterized membrane protein
MIDVLMVREHLRRSTAASTEVDKMMQEAFPRTYPFALRFDSLVEREAADIAIRRHPEIASNPMLAMQLTGREVQILSREHLIDIKDTSHRSR